MNARQPTTLIDLSDLELWRQGVPHDEFTRLRREAPVSWNERGDGQAGFWAVTRYDDIVTVLRDTDAYTSRHGVISLDDFDDEQNESRRTLLETDPPRHTTLRKVTSRQFTPRAVRAFQEFVRACARAFVEESMLAGGVDVVDALSKQIPILTLCKVMGIPPDRRADMIRWSDALIGTDDPEYIDQEMGNYPVEQRRLLPFGHPASLEAFDLGRELREARRAAPVDDVVGSLALGEADGEPLTDQEFCNYFLMLVVADNETTRHTISHGIKAIADFPDEWERFRAGTIDSNVAAGEVLRWASAVHFVRRAATADVELGGAEIRAGDKVAVYFVSGNRDEAHFDHPDWFIIYRAPNNHLSFGRSGPHFCLGSHVARMQVRIVLEELAAQVRSITLDGEVKRLRSNHIHGIKHLPAILVPDW